MNRRLITLCAMGLLAVGSVPNFAAAAEDPPAEKVGDNDIVVVIGAEPTEGRPVMPATDTEFRLKLRDTGDVVAFRWLQLEENERKRVQKLYGLEVVDDRRRMGNKINGVKYNLESGKSIEGMLIPERSQHGKKAIRTATTPLMVIDERDIKSTETIECYESDFYSAREIYDRMIMEKPPSKEDAASHLEYARTCGNMGLYKEALEHLTIAEIIDPRTKERNQEDRISLIREHARQESNKLYDQLLRFRRAQEFFLALDVLQKLDRNFPNDEYRPRWDMLRQEITDGVKAELAKKVIQSAYGVASDLIQQRYYKKVKLDEKGNVVASIPGKQVTTRQGDIFRGTIIDPENNGFMIIKVGDMTLKVRQKDIMSVQDVDLSVGAREVNPTYDDLKEYVTDLGSPTGLKGQMIAKLMAMTSQPEAKIREIFDTRLNREATYSDGKMDRSAVYATNHDAFYGRGSWLRDGSKPLPAPQLVTAGQGNGNGNGNGRNGNGNGNGGQQQANPADSNPDATDDPAVWWKFQNSETHLQILRAFAAEKVFSAKKADSVQNIPCKNCGTKGTIPMMSTGGNYVQVRCPECRGIGVFFRIIYQ